MKQKMRKAFIGLSTPIGFDYNNRASQSPADVMSSPNPVLDSPFGLLLLFDELVFLTRSLCPENMRGLPYVSFLDEKNLLPHIAQDDIDAIWRAVRDASEEPIPNKISFRKALANTGVIDGMGIKKHSHWLRVGEIVVQAMSDLCNLSIDAYIYSRLNIPLLELVPNSRLQDQIDSEQRVANQSLLTQIILIENIPNYLTPKGPYHPVIEEVRNNPSLAAFREWITRQHGLTSPQEVMEVKAEVENALKEAQEKIFLKYCEPKRHYRSVGKALLGDAVGFLFPVAGTVKALLDAGTDILNPESMRWQSFIVGARRDTRASMLKKARG